MRRNGLVLTPTGIRNVILPLRAVEAKARQLAQISTSPLLKYDYTYMDDGWTLRPKQHMAAEHNFRPRSAPQLVSIQNLDSKQLHDLIVARC